MHSSINQTDLEIPQNVHHQQSGFHLSYGAILEPSVRSIDKFLKSRTNWEKLTLGCE